MKEDLYKIKEEDCEHMYRDGGDNRFCVDCGKNMEKLTKEDLIVFTTLLVKNRDDAGLQLATGLSYLESINLLNKVRGLIQNI